MHLKALLRLSVIFAVLAAATINVNAAARRVILRPLTAEQVVRVLKLAGREDAIPEGRVVTQGLAAMTGFALGLTKGIGGSFLVDLATSNATAEFINNFNATAMMGDFQGINMTALVQMFNWGSANNPSVIKYKTTEICFDTVNKNSAVALEGRQANFETAPIATNSVTATTGSGTGDDMTDNTNTGSGVATSIDDNTGTNTDSSTTTETDNDNGQTCLVFEKPILSRSRSLQRKRRY